jgi:hypothetical protein
MRVNLELVVMTIVLAVAVVVTGCDSTGKFVHEQAAFVQGVVSDEETGSLLDSVAMRLLEVPNDTLAHPIYTDTSGYYIMVVGRTGQFYVMARKNGYQQAIVQVHLRGGDTVTVNFELGAE